MADSGPAKVLRPAAPPPSVAEIVPRQPVSPYGKAQHTQHRERHAVVPPHMVNPARLTVQDLLIQDASTSKGPAARTSMELAGLPSVNPRKEEASGVLSIQRKKRIENPLSFRPQTAQDKIVERSVRYYTDGFPRKQHSNANIKQRLDSSGVKASLDAAAAGAEPRRTARCPSTGAILNKSDHVKQIFEGSGDVLPAHRRDSIRPTSALAAEFAYYGTGVRDVINGVHGEPAAYAAPRDAYGSTFGMHTERPATASVEPGRRHFSRHLLDSNHIGELLVHHAPPVDLDSRHGGFRAGEGMDASVGGGTPRSAVSGSVPYDSSSVRYGHVGHRDGSIKYERALRGETAAAAFRDERAAAEPTFHTTYRATFNSAHAEDGPRAKTPPRRQRGTGAAYGGVNNPYRETSIY